MTVDVLNPEAVAQLLGCAPVTVRERARAGDLPGLKFGDDWVFPAGALARRLDELALEDSAKRRKKPVPSGQLVALPGAKVKRKPPALPV